MPQTPRIERQQTAGELAAPLEVGLDDSIAVEAENRDVFEMTIEHRPKLVGLEQIHVVGVLEVSGRVRCDEERRPLGAEHPRRLLDVALGLMEVLDEMGRADPVERSGAHRELRSVARRRAQVAACLVSRDRRLGVVVHAEHSSSTAQEERAAVTETTADVEEAPGTDSLEHLAVARGVQRHERVGRLAFDGTLASKSQPVTFRGARSR